MGLSAPTIVAGRTAVVGLPSLTWTEDGVAYWAISDLGSTDLDTFAKVFREAGAQQ